MNCELVKTTVHGYFDGELDVMRSVEFEQHIETCAECQAELQQLGSLRTAFQESDLYEPASPQLREQIYKLISEEERSDRVGLFRWRRLLVLPTFGALAAAAAVLVIMFFVFQSHSQSTQITAELIDAHVRSLQPGHLMDVESTDQHTVKPWFDGKLDFIPPVSDFAQQGFSLVGGRLDIIDGHDVAALVYGRGKHYINLFVWPYRQKESSIASAGSHEGYNWLTWQSGDMQFCLVSDAAAPDLRELKNLIHQ